MREWLRRWIAGIVREQLDGPVIHTTDPLLAAARDADHVTPLLAAACNQVGRGVIVGRDVVLWGGKHPAGVGLVLGDRVRLYDHCRLVIDQLSADSGITLGTGVAMNFGCYIEGGGGVAIGAGTILGPNVVIVSTSHVIDRSVPIQQSGKRLARVRIGEGVWIGANAVIRMGITIGDGAVVGAGAVVTRDVPAGAVVVGNPARPADGK